MSALFRSLDGMGHCKKKGGLLFRWHFLGYFSSASEVTRDLQGKKDSLRSGNLFKGKRLHDLLHQVEVLQQRHGIPISRDFAYSLLRECLIEKNLECGRKIQALMVHAKLESIPVLSDHLIRLFTSCGCLDEARQAFSKVVKPTVYTWSAIIAAHARLSQGEEALQLYERMLQSGTKSDKHTYVAVLQACSSIGILKRGMRVHQQIVRSELKFDIVVWNTIADMYIKCGSLEQARKIFDEMPSRDVVSWGVMIVGYAQFGEGHLALACFENMKHEGIKPNAVIFSSILKACGSVCAIKEGREIHDQVNINGLQSNAFIASALIDMYCKCGKLNEARDVFNGLLMRDIVSWGAMISGYGQHGEVLLTLECFQNMKNEGIKPNNAILSSVLKACGNAGSIDQGMQIHEEIIKSGFQLDIVGWNTLVDMYAKCGRLEQARNVFDRLPTRNVVSWSIIIAGYVQYDEGVLALECYDEMQQYGVNPDKLTFLSILKACGRIGAIERGKDIHKQIVQSNLQFEIPIGNALIDMHAKCGNMHDAQILFEKLPDKNVITWSAMISGHAQLGNAGDAAQCFKGMQDIWIEPNDVTFISLLIVCSHTGLVDEGRECFRSMIQCHGIIPNIFHSTCMVDLLGRAGLFKEAEILLEAKEEPNILGWKALLNASKMHGNMEVGRRCFKEIVDLDSYCGAGYILMSNIYADSYI